jgi:hypothetical protein
MISTENERAWHAGSDTLPPRRGKESMGRTQERLDRNDKQIGAIRELVKEGMRLMVETRKDLRTLAAMQKRSDAKLEALTDMVRRSGGNGHPKSHTLRWVCVPITSDHPDHTLTYLSTPR